MRAPSRIILALALALLTAGCGGRPDEAKGTQDWPTITADDNSYTVSMPKQPKQANQSVPAPQGTINVSMKQLVTKHVTYTVGYSTYPPGFLDAMGPNDDARMDRAMAATVRKTNASNITSEKTTVEGFSGRTVSMNVILPQTDKRATMRQIMVIADGRMFIAQAIILVGAPESENKNASRFLNSFALKAPEQGS